MFPGVSDRVRLIAAFEIAQVQVAKRFETNAFSSTAAHAPQLMEPESATVADGKSPLALLTSRSASVPQFASFVMPHSTGDHRQDPFVLSAQGRFLAVSADLKW